MGSTPRSTTGDRCRRDHRERTRPSPCQARPSSRIARSAAVPPPPGRNLCRCTRKVQGGGARTPPTLAANPFRRWRRPRVTPAGAAHDNRPVTLLTSARLKGRHAAASRGDGDCDDDLVGVVDVALVANVIKQPTGCVAREHSVARGGCEESARAACVLRPLAPPPSCPEGRVMTAPAGSPLRQVWCGYALTKRQPGSKDAGLRRLLDGSVARKVTRLVVRDSD